MSSSSSSIINDLYDYVLDIDRWSEAPHACTEAWTSRADAGACVNVGRHPVLGWFVISSEDGTDESTFELEWSENGVTHQLSNPSLKTTKETS
jgi:hypothetical protein